MEQLFTMLPKTDLNVLRMVYLLSRSKVQENALRSGYHKKIPYVEQYIYFKNAEAFEKFLYKELVDQKTKILLILPNKKKKISRFTIH